MLSLFSCSGEQNKGGGEIAHGLAPRPPASLLMEELAASEAVRRHLCPTQHPASAAGFSVVAKGNPSPAAGFSLPPA